MTIQELYSDSSKWTQGTYARTISGQETNPIFKDASKWCLLGGISKCYPTPELFKPIRDIVCSNLPVYSICEWNDDPSRTFEEVKALVAKLGI